MLAQRHRTDRQPVDREQQRAQVASIVQRIRIACILDWKPVPGGKALRFWTGSECKSFGKMFALIAEHVPPGALVGEVLIESEARKLLGASK